MHELTQAYEALVTSPSALAKCSQAPSISALWELLKKSLGCVGCSDADLLAALSVLNRQSLGSEACIQLVGTWLPVHYHPRQGQVEWCLPLGAPSEPFHDEYIGRCKREQLVNAFVAPRTRLPELDLLSPPGLNLAGFVFHVSRCGSTLISGGLSELENTVVFSEAPVLTELLLDVQLSSAQKVRALRSVLACMGAAFADRPGVIVKWNAWDALFWDVILASFAQVPCVVLVRNPIEVLASHHKQAGRHMSGDPTLTYLGEAFDASVHDGVLSHRIHVLGILHEALERICAVPQCLLLDYSHFSAHALQRVMDWFQLSPTELEHRRMARRFQLHSKSLGVVFQSDALHKRRLFNSREQEAIESALWAGYLRLLDFAPERG